MTDNSDRLLVEEILQRGFDSIHGTKLVAAYRLAVEAAAYRKAVNLYQEMMRQNPNDQESDPDVIVDAIVSLITESHGKALAEHNARLLGPIEVLPTKYRELAEGAVWPASDVWRQVADELEAAMKEPQ